MVIAVGGGIVTDVAGFAAATYHRGTAYVNVATSLLAQVDAAIGGKTGVNLPEGKNLVGAFWQPHAVLCDTETLHRCRRASGPAGGARSPSTPSWARPPGADQPIEEQVARCVAIKAAVVSEDEREGDRRMILNYGHTLAHALEAAALERAPRLGPAPRRGGGHRAPLRGPLAERLGRIDAARVAEHRAVVGQFRPAHGPAAGGPTPTSSSRSWGATRRRSTT